MKALLRLSQAIDALNTRIGHAAMWLVLASVLISAGNATVRKLFNTSSNAWLEIQWYLFAAVFLLCAGTTLLHDEHVRIDVVSGRLSRRAQTWIDIVGLVTFLAPLVALTLWLSWPFFLRGLQSGEMSSNVGGLVRWPVYLLIPVGFGLLGLQGISELIKRVAFLRGQIEDPGIKKAEKTPEETLAEAIRAQAEAAAHKVARS